MESLSTCTSFRDLKDARTTTGLAVALEQVEWPECARLHGVQNVHRMFGLGMYSERTMSFNKVFVVCREAKLLI